MNGKKFDSLIRQTGKFDREQRDALFAAVLAHDDIYDKARLPDHIPLAESPDELLDCFVIVLKLFEELESVDRARAFLEDLAGDPDAAAVRLDTLKHPRARFKHIQFTMHVCGERHRYPPLLHGATVLMGEVQDALKLGDTRKAVRLSRIARIMLGKVGKWRIRRELGDFEASPISSYRDHLFRQIEQIAAFLTGDQVTGKGFHAARKVVSRLMAHYDNLTILAPSPEKIATARFISTVNGLMGGFHDRLVARKASADIDYARENFALPAEHRVMLTALVTGLSTALEHRSGGKR